MPIASIVPATDRNPRSGLVRSRFLLRGSLLAGLVAGLLAEGPWVRTATAAGLDPLFPNVRGQQTRWAFGGPESGAEAADSAPPLAPAACRTGPPVVAIDAGHGGKDTGAIGPRGIREKDVVLGIARRLSRLLQTEGGLRPVLVRRDDRFISLRQRPAIARAAGADLLVSIHADADPSGRVRGMSVYSARAAGAGEKAAASILSAIRRQFTVHHRQVQKAGFAVLKSPSMPSVLVETGFISHPKGEQELASPAAQGRIARSILHGVRRFFAHTRSRPVASTLAAARQQNRRR